MYLGAGGQGLEDVIDLVLESTGKHLISLIKNEHLDSVGAENIAIQHIRDTTWSSDNDVNSIAELGDIITDL